MGAKATQYFSFGETGEIGVGVTEVQGPSRKCRKVMFTAHPSNTGIIYVGHATGVTTADNATDTTTGFPRSAGQDTGWVFAGNLNEFFFIASAAGQSVCYMYDL
jgi:hypothetical protein